MHYFVAKMRQHSQTWPQKLPDGALQAPKIVKKPYVFKGFEDFEQVLEKSSKDRLEEPRCFQNALKLAILGAKLAN